MSIDRTNSVRRLQAHQNRLAQCRRCPAMQGPPVLGAPVPSPVLLLGQAPGAREIEVHRPFAWTAGKTLFRWFAGIGMPETLFRERIFMAAVCRCFPGKRPGGGDRVPGPAEIEACGAWLAAELQLLRPRLIVPVGKLAISQLLPVARLQDVVGRRHQVQLHGQAVDVIPLPHPSGVSVWYRREPGKSLLQKALKRIEGHPAWVELGRA